MSKKCAHCNETKPISGFYKTRNGVMRVCRVCHVARCQKRMRELSLEDRRKVYRRAREINLDGRKAAEKKWNRKRRAEGWFYTSEKRAYHKIFRDRLKAEVFQAYGGKCACCGDTAIPCLTIDHVNNDGGAERRSHKGRNATQVLYTRLRQENYPPGYRVLCFSCNVGRHIAGGGECPHQLEVMELWQELLRYAARQESIAA